MATINKKYINTKPVKYRHESKEQAASFYNSMAWKRLRDTYLSTHPLCECCLEHERVTPATDVHHIRPWNRGKTEEEKWNLLLDEKNLMSVCQDCHYALHFKDKQYNMLMLNDLTDIEYKYAHGLNYLKN